MDASDPSRSRRVSVKASGAAAGAVWCQLTSLLGTLRTSPFRRGLTWLAIGIAVVICINMVGQVRLNTWHGDFFDALEQRKLQVFVQQTLVFFVIVGGLLVIVVAETWLREILEVRLREWLTCELLDRWMAPKRAYLLGLAGDIGVNPDQRLQADVLRLSELSISLSIGLLRSVLLLVSFLSVLWLLSSDILFVVGESRFTIPGYLVWCALAYAISGSWLTWRVGRPLIAINAERYAREAELRYALVRVNDCAEAISVHGGEAGERRALDPPVDGVVQITRRLASGLARLTWITSGYGWVALLVPILAAAPGYFQGTLSFGGLMMTIGAFNQVQAALRWFVDSFPQIADWRATLHRVAALHEALPRLETLGDDAGRIRLVQQPSRTIAFEDVSVALTDGCLALDEARVELAPGDHLLIVGESGSGKSALFRAMAGVWPWGSGTLQLPPRESSMFVPQRPYLPLGGLRSAVTYPADPGRFDDAALAVALGRVGLDHLTPALDREERWDKELSLEEQQRLALARLVLHRPRAAFFDEAIDALDDEQRRLIRSLFERELADTTVVSIGGAPARDGFYNRTVRAVRLSGGAGLNLNLDPRPAAAVEARTPAAAGFAGGRAPVPAGAR